MAAGSGAGLECQAEESRPKPGPNQGRDTHSELGLLRLHWGVPCPNHPAAVAEWDLNPFLPTPGPTLRGLQAHLVAMPPEWSLDDGNGLPVESGQGCPWREAGSVAKEGRGARTLSPRCLLAQPHLKLRISGQELRVDARLPEAGLCSRYHLYPPPSSPGLSQPPCPSSVELLPACLPVLPLPAPPLHLTDCGSKMAQIYGSTHQK